MMILNAPEPRSSLGQYRPLAQLGQGGMARVLLVAREGPANIQKLLVVKEIREELANDAEFVTMFMDEARIATRMSHPNVVQTYEVGAEGQHYFMVMEYLEGQPMHAVLGRIKRKLPLAVHLRILERVLAGLHYAHELRGFDGKPLEVVHRDVSPQNTILCYDGQVKLVDFGIAKAAGVASRTTAGKFKGKLGYVAPEQIAGGDIDRRADVFSAGVMLWEALVGRRLTYGENEASVLHKRTTGTQARVLEARPEADPELAAICDRAMELDPERRFPMASDMLNALEARTEALDTRASDGDIGRLVSDAFAEERKGILAIVERQLSLPARSATDASAVAKLPLLPSETGPNSLPPSGTLPWSSVSPSNAPPTIAGTSTSVGAEAPASRKSKRVVVLAAGAGVIVLAGIIATVVASKGETATAVAHASATASSQPTPSATSTPSEATVDVAIEVVPARAKISIDGRTVGKSPFRAAVPKDTSAHTLVASADGYSSETRTLGFDRDVRLELALRPIGTVGHAAAVPMTSGSALPSAGSELQVARPKHNIDEKDPY
jgi:serine/threonine protein kinase